MNNLQDYLVSDYNGKAREEAIVQFSNVRFTILTPRVIRMEYCPEKDFEDSPSQVFCYRKQEIPEYSVSKNKNELIIETKNLSLLYELKSDGFTSGNPKIDLKNSNSHWEYGDKNEGNLKGTIRTLDGIDGRCELDKGLISREGWEVIDDSESLFFTEDGWVSPRRKHEKYEDIYFFGYGKNYKKALQDYCKIAGSEPLIPRWMLGNWWSKYWDFSQSELKSLMMKFKDNDIPISVCVIDMDWHIVDNEYTSGWTGFSWNRELFPEPEKLINWLHDENIFASLNLHPASGIHPHEESYNRAAERMQIDPGSEKPIKFDISNPKFNNVYFEEVLQPLEEMGVDFWWIDWQQGTDSEMPGLDPLWGLNHLHFMNSKRNDKRPAIFSRWSGLGSHRYPIGFSGDTIVSWDSLQFQPYFTYTASNVSYSWWSHDIGGHIFGEEDSELFARWVQFGALSPILRLHASKNYYLVRKPWEHTVEAYEVSKKAMQFRNSLVPYIYSMNWLNYKKDISLIRPMYYNHPNKDVAYSLPNQYYFGSECLAAPHTKPRKGKELNLSKQIMWLPEGEWFDFFTGGYYSGDRIIARYGKLDDLPLLAKKGSIVPQLDDFSETAEKNSEKLKLNIFPGNNEFNLYEDDGKTQEYIKGDYFITKIKQQLDPGRLTLKIATPDNKPDYIPRNRKYTIIFKPVFNPGKIDLKLADKKFEDYNESYDEDFGQLILSLERISSSADLKITLKKEGKIIKKDKRKLDRVRYILKNMKIKTRAKACLEEIIVNNSPEGLLKELQRFTSILSQKQLRCLVESFAGIGAEEFFWQRKRFIRMWNNNNIPGIKYNISSWSRKKASGKTGDIMNYREINCEEYEEELAQLKLDVRNLYSLKWKI